jgi:hypothetical protein
MAQAIKVVLEAQELHPLLQVQALRERVAAVVLPTFLLVLVVQEVVEQGRCMARPQE